MTKANLIIRDTGSTLWRTEPRYWAGNHDGSYDGTDRWTTDRNAANVYTADEAKAFPKVNCSRFETRVALPSIDPDDEPDFDPENIYGSPSIRQSIEEDRRR